MCLTNDGKELVDCLGSHGHTAMYMYMKPVHNSVLLELYVPDFEKDRDFYGKRAFEVVWEIKPAGKNGNLVLSL